MRVANVINALLAGALGVQGAPGSSDIDNALNVVNTQRVANRVAPLTWNANLANAAAIWAGHLKAINQVIHATEEQRANQGEVLAYFTADTLDSNVLHPFTAAANTWLAGGAHYPPGGVIGDGSEPWNHWAQLMWATTTEIGCGIAQSLHGTENKVFVVCRLTPEGNIVGEAPFPSENTVDALQARQDMGKGPYTGDITHFTTGLGACGFDDTGLPGILALSHEKMGAPSNSNALCNKRVKLQANGKVAYATVRDKCMGCKFQDIDVSEDVFLALYGDLGIGRAPVTWEIL